MPWCYPVHIGDGPLAKGNRAGRGVGIGTTGPNALLAVNGNVDVQGKRQLVKKSSLIATKPASSMLQT